jgi:predicted ATPase
LLQRIGPRYAELLHRHHTIIRGVVAATSGTEEGVEGDGFFVSFPAPSAALGAAVEAQLRLEHEAWPRDARIRVRMGLHRGDVEATQTGLVGLAIHHAARIAAAGHGGQIVVSEATRTSLTELPPSVQLRSLGNHRLRDVGAMVLYQVTHPALAGEFPPLRSQGQARHNLPAPLTTFVGRAAEASAVGGLLAHRRLVTLTGAGGSGKTRLALHIAAEELPRHQDGVWFVDLAPLNEGADIVPTVGAALGLGDRQLDVIISALVDQEGLLVVDNCEHVHASAAEVISRILAGCARMGVLATSRQRLGIMGEAVFPLPPLSLPTAKGAVGDAFQSDAFQSEAVRLFVDRAALARPDYRPADDIDFLVDICRRLDGMPLSIELAAARIGGLHAHQIADRLHDQLNVLVSDACNLPARQRTLRATLDWSYGLLEQDERTVLRGLAIFPDSCDLAAVEAVCGPALRHGTALLDVLASLREKSMVRVVDAAGTRFGLHEAIRQYAREAASAEGEEDSLRARHAAWFAALADGLAGGPQPGGERAWIDCHDTERTNLRTAAEHLLQHDVGTALGMLLAIEPGVAFTTQTRWVYDLLSTAAATASGAPRGDRARALVALMPDAPGREAVDRLLDEALSLARGVGDPVVEAVVHAQAALRDAERGHGAVDEAEVRIAVDAADRAGGGLWPYIIRRDIATRSPPRLADLLGRGALAKAEEHAFETFAAIARSILADVAAFEGRSRDALAMADEIMPLLDTLIDGSMNSLQLFPLIEGEHGDLERAIRLAEHIRARLLSRPRDPGIVGGVCSVGGYLLARAGELDRAEELTDQASRVFGTSTASFVAALHLVTRSMICRQRGQPGRAGRALASSQDAGWIRGLTDIEMRVLEELAAVALELGHPQAAADLLVSSDERRERDGKPVSPARRGEIDELRARVDARDARSLEQQGVQAVLRALLESADHP